MSIGSLSGLSTMNSIGTEKIFLGRWPLSSRFYIPAAFAAVDCFCNGVWSALRDVVPTCYLCWLFIVVSRGT